VRVRYGGRRRRPGRRLSAGLAAALCLVLAGCGVGSVALRQPQHLTIRASGGNGVRRLPFTVSWSSTYPAGTEYVLFLDQAPIPPDQDMRYVAEQLHDTSCLIQPGCPDAAYLDNLNIFTTTKTSYVFSTLPISGNRDNVSLHELTIVALDRSGRRIGEASATMSFRIPTADTGT
jgi:hypothetical protein